ncbi:MAG: hypothetical protein PWP51_1519 [Clostridiales bacterium]|nr:hypothetical protein [Clostridiales bacterium]
MIRSLLKMMKRLIVVCLIVGVLMAIVLYFPRLRASVVMTASCAYEMQKAEQTMALSIPVEDADHLLAWYPKMLVYNDRGGYNRLNGTDAVLTIYYAFGAFNGYGPKAHASFYDLDSAYYASFFGGYVIGNAGGDWSNAPDLLASVPRYDYTQLILSALGCPDEKLKFDYEVLEARDDVKIADTDHWMRYDLHIETTGVTHPQQAFLLHDLQFGPSPKGLASEAAFEPIDLYAVVYAKYFETQDTEIMLYVLTSDKMLLNQTDALLLSKTAIQIIN